MEVTTKSTPMSLLRRNAGRQVPVHALKLEKKGLRWRIWELNP